jgi:WD40 repeat protein
MHPNRAGVLEGLQFSPDGRRIIAGDYPGGVVMVWDAATAKQLTTIETGYGYRGTARYFFLSPDWQTLYVPRPGKRNFERVEQGSKQQYRRQFNGDVAAWDLATGHLKQTFQHQPPRYLLGMELSPDQRRFVTFEQLPGTSEGSPKQSVSLWDARTGTYRSLPDGLEADGRLSPDGQTLALSASDGNGYNRAVKLFDMTTGQEKLSLPIRDKNAWCSVSAFSPDSRVMVGVSQVFERPKKWDSFQCCLKWWDAATGRELTSFAGEKNEGLSAYFSPDGQTLVVTNWQGKKAQLLLFQVANRQLTKTILLGEKAQGQRLIMRLPAFSADSKWLAVITQAFPDTRSASEPDVHDVPQPRIHLIDVTRGTIQETLISPPSFAASACFSPDGRTLAIGGHGKVLLWDLTNPPRLT